MLILHIADIHFCTPQCLNPDTDPDLPFRTRMLQDLRTQVQTLGPVGAILIGGDIAYKGAAEEYSAAMKWIKELMAVSGCPIERVFSVPGNHDIDRAIIRQSPAIRNAQNAILGAQSHRREFVLREQFEDSDTGKTLLRPLAAYNDFAKFFNCQVYTPDRLYWKQDLPLTGGVRLRLNGLTSTILSGAEGSDDHPRDLYVSPLQTTLNPEDDVVNLVIAHHPPDWCMDNDAIEDDVSGRAAIHLFGHKHRQRILREENYVRIGAAAVNPDRYELGFEPGYNLVEINVVGEGATRTLEVIAHLLHWRTNPEGYQPRMNGDERVFRKTIRIPGHVAMVIAVSPPELKGAPVDAIPAVPERDAVDVEAAMSDEPTRNLVYRFWKLTGSQRRDIANALALLEKGEMALPEPERYGRALLRAGERGLIDALANEIQKREGSDGPR